MYNIHALSGVTEGGVLGATLLFDHWFGLSPAVSSFVLNIACYALGMPLLFALDKFRGKLFGETRRKEE